MVMHRLRWGVNARFCRDAIAVIGIAVRRPAGAVPRSARWWHSRCMPLFVLVHSPSVGPSTWAPVAGQLAASGCDAVVPSLLSVADGGPPFWPRVVAAVTAGLAGADPGQPLVVVAHSNAGVFVPVIERGLARTVTWSVFADATVPASSGHTRSPQSSSCRSCAAWPVRMAGCPDGPTGGTSARWPRCPPARRSAR
jgi:hypothetical protein